jgi:glycosyltransferase involved in cell wall biosynthesis
MMYETEATPLVSVVMPSSRGGPWLEEAVRSVLAQTYSNWELLLVDNGLDHPLPPWIVDTKKIKVIQEARSGPSPARNAGISAALGSYVAFLDDDDRWLPHKLDVQVRALQGDPEASLCSCDLNMIDEAGDVIGSNITPARSYETLLRTGRGFMPSTMMCPLELVRSVGCFDENRRFVEDLVLCIRLLDTGPALVLGEVLADYRRHRGNSSRDYEGMNRASCELPRIERRRAVSERRMDRVLYSLRGEWVTRFVWGRSLPLRRRGSDCERSLSRGGGPSAPRSPPQSSCRARVLPAAETKARSSVSATFIVAASGR